MVNVTCIGSGFVGEAVGYGLKMMGHDVVMHDISKDRLNELSQAGFVTELDLEAAVMASDYLFVQVPTLSTKDGIDMGCVDKVVSDLKPLLDKYGGKYVILKSTVKPGSTRKIASELNARVVFCPEFLQEKSAKWDFLNPDRMVFGGFDNDTKHVANALFVRFKKCPFYFMSFEEAEMVKYASNLWFATNISFWNDIVSVCDFVKADSNLVHEAVMAGMFFGKHPWKIGEPFGGSCLPKDTRALNAFAKDNKISIPVIDAVEETNISVGGRNYGKD